MRMKILGTVFAGALLSTAALAAGGPDATSGTGTSPSPATTGSTETGPDTSGTAGPSRGAVSGSSSTSGSMNLTQLCASTRLSTSEQADCRTRANAATTESQRMEVQRMFADKAGMTSGASGTTGTPGGTLGSPGSGGGTTRGNADATTRGPGDANNAVGTPAPRTPK